MLKFSKMHGLGNDFVIIDAVNQSVDLTPLQVRHLADRHRGVGCDQLLLVESSDKQNIDFKYRIFNADGGEVAQCGNGARCFARFVYDKGLTDKTTIAVETASGVIYPELQTNGDVSVNMGRPAFKPSQIPFRSTNQAVTYQLTLANGEDVEFGSLSMGNPHAILVVEDIQKADVAVIGPQLESNLAFPDRVNVGFMQIVDRQHIRLRVYERGAGETQACGTGACAAVVNAIQRGLVDGKVTVTLTGGELAITWLNDNADVWMTGPATHVFDGEIPWQMV